MKYLYRCEASTYESLGGYSYKKGKHELYFKYKLYVSYMLYSISEIDIAAILEMMYKENEDYDADNNRCKKDKDCTFFKYVSTFL